MSLIDYIFSASEPDLSLIPPIIDCQYRAADPIWCPRKEVAETICNFFHSGEPYELRPDFYRAVEQLLSRRDSERILLYLPLEYLYGAPASFKDTYLDEKGKVQEFFTMEEAQKLIVPVLEDTQWRLPTRHDIECIIDELQHKIWDTLHLVGGGYTAHNYERKHTERCGDGPFYLILRSARDEKSYYQPVLCGVDFRFFDRKPRIMVYDRDCGFRVRCVSGQAE